MYLTEMAKDTVGAAQCSSSAREGTRFSTNPQSSIILYFINISIINVRFVSVLVYVDLSLCVHVQVYVSMCTFTYFLMYMCLHVCPYMCVCVCT